MNAEKKPRKKRRIVRKIIIWLIILLILAGCGYYAYTSLRAQYKVTYNSYTASIGSVSNSLSFSGNLSLVNSETYTASASTTVKKVYVAAGDEVKEGDKLVRLANGTTVESGLDGKVNVINVEVDDDVNAGDTLVQVADFTHLMVSFRIDEYDITEVHVGDACTVTTTATEKTFDSTISTIDYISNGGNVAYYTAVAYVDVDSDVYPGMQATVTITQEEAKDVVILKEDALSFDSKNNAYVLMYDDNGELQQVDVEIGVSNGNYVEIKSGLSDGDVVYVVAPVEETTSGAAGLLSGIFGSTQVNDPSAMGGGSFPGGGDFSGGNFRSGSSDRSSGSSGGGGFQGGGGGFPGGGN